MERKNLFKQTCVVLAVLMLVIGFTLFPNAPSFAAPGKDYVIVIDISTSMQDIFDEVKKLTDKTIKQATEGDTVVIITFGEGATLLARKPIHGQADIDALQSQVDSLYPTDYSTYLTGGLEKGLSELKYLFEKHPDRERILLWLSDDKDNPPSELGKDVITMDKLREENKNFEPGREWFAYDAPLAEVKDQRLEDFITWARRTTFRVGVREDNINLGSFEEGNVDKKITLTFEPKHPGAAGLEFSTGALLVDPKDPTRTIPVTFSPSRIVASGRTWQQQFEVAFKGEPGEYKGELTFQSLSGPVLDVEPNKVMFTAMIVPPKLPEPAPVPEIPEAAPEEPKERGAGIIAKEDRPPGMERAEKPLTFGPLEPGKKDSKIITLFLSKEADAKSIMQDPLIQLPQGITIASKVYGRRGVQLAAEITVSVDQNIQLPENTILQGAYEGSMRFKSSDAEVRVLPLNIPIRVEMNTDKVRWGPKLLAPEVTIGRTRARSMSFEELTKALGGGTEAKPASPVITTLRTIYSKVASRYVLFPVLGIVILLFVWLLYRMRAPSELFVGELVAIKDPTNSKMKNANLKRIGSLHGKDVLSIGSSPKADIRLNHASVSAVHCKLSARKNEDQVEISLVPIKGIDVKVNDIECFEKTRLSDKDLIGIGGFILLFSNPEAQKEVVARFLDGRTMRGTPVTWDIGAASFELLRSDVGDLEETAEEITVVNYADLKAVFFMQDASATRPSVPKDRINTRMIIQATFFDGEQIEGHPLTDYSDSAGRFYLVPREMPNIISILVERNSVKKLTKREAGVELEGQRAANLLGVRRARKGAAPAE